MASDLRTISNSTVRSTVLEHTFPYPDRQLVARPASRAHRWHHRGVTLAPMLVTPGRVLPTGPEWVYEVKWDGARALVTIGERVRVHSRHGRDHTAALPELAGLAGLQRRATVVLDGELICLDPGSGRPAFERLMGRLGAGLPGLAARLAPVTFMAFDVLMVDGESSCSLPWAARRALLEDLHREGADPVWRINTAFDDGGGLLTATAGMGLEGVVAKRTTSRYQPGRRSRSWRKFKHQTVEWFDLVGWRPPKGREAGGLIAYESGRYVAAAFPGLPAVERDRLASVLAANGRETSAGIELKPGLAEVEVAYLERMPDGRLREPVARAVRSSEGAS